MRSISLLPGIFLGSLIAACGGGKDSGTTSGGTAAVATVGSGGAGGGGGAGGDTASGGGGGTTSSTTSTSTGGAGGAGGATPTCEDGEQNGLETDVDCGGGECAACGPGQACEEPADCLTEECVEGVCSEASCDDGETNGGESDVDCGGPCVGCEEGLSCVDGEDCLSLSCGAGGVCVAATCTDGAANGAETDVDCGGPVCNDCPAGDLCNVPGDCQSGVCTGGVCQEPTCDDGVENGSETDLDCGAGGECPDCRAGQSCSNGGNCVSGTCTGGQCACPANMVIVPVLGGGAYCIDQAEVTYEQYDAFMDANPQIDIPECDFNDEVDNNYTPSALWPPNDDVATEPNYKWKPVRYVDWCDAKAYCTWANKRLCGAIEGGGLDPALVGDTTQSQWQNACSNQGTNDYPYGDLFSTDACTESVTTTSTGPSNVRNQTGYFDVCEGGAPSLHQLSGNLAEWEDACDSGSEEAGLCVLRGGSFLSDEDLEVSCNGMGSIQQLPRNTREAHIGFRCCQ